MPLGKVIRVPAMTSEIESDGDTFEAPAKGIARRRVDAYHEVLRERAALAELEQPFVVRPGRGPLAAARAVNELG